MTESQKRQFEEQGFCLLPSIITPEELVKLRSATGDLSRQQRMHSGQVGNLTLRDSRYRELAVNARVGQTIHEFTDWDIIYLLYSKVNVDQSYYKTWHQDNRYWLKETGEPTSVTLWLAVEDATPENGCLSILPGSHKEIVPHTKGETGWEVREDRFPALFPGRVPLQCPVSAGSALVFHGNLLHRSELNRSQTDRCAVILGFDYKKRAVGHIRSLASTEQTGCRLNATRRETNQWTRSPTPLRTDTRSSASS